MNLAATIWLMHARRDYQRFCRKAHGFEKCQRDLLAKILKTNRGTTFGKDHQFKTISGYGQFAKSVPISDYETLRPYIAKQLAGSKALFQEKISFVETTSGSTAQPKRLPYNKSLRQVFSAMANVWMYSLARQYPSLWQGKAYWSLSPALKPLDGTKASPLKDEDYLSGLTKKLMAGILAVPNDLTQERDATAFYDQTWVHLLSQKRVVFFSVWSPTFLIGLLRHLDERQNIIFSLLENLPARKAKRGKRRLSSLNGALTLSGIFPECKVVSCWTDAQAKIHLPGLIKLLGDEVEIQGKGLLATEGVVSLPMEGGSPVLAYLSHFYEFKEVGAETVQPAWELAEGKKYEVLLTTQAGLYRYSTGDLVEVSGFWKGVPRLRFIGRNNLLGDFVGEKLSSQHVLEVFGILQKKGIGAYAMTWQPDDGVSGYVVLVDKLPTTPLKSCVEEMLRHNPYFAQAQNLRQMSALSWKAVKPEIIQKAMEGLRLQKGISEGDFKTPLFIPSEFLRNV